MGDYITSEILLKWDNDDDFGHGVCDSDSALEPGENSHPSVRAGTERQLNSSRRGFIPPGLNCGRCRCLDVPGQGWDSSQDTAGWDHVKNPQLKRILQLNPSLGCEALLTLPRNIRCHWAPACVTPFFYYFFRVFFFPFAFFPLSQRLLPGNGSIFGTDSFANCSPEIAP